MHNQKLAILLHSLSVLQIDYSDITAFLFNFYEKLISHVQILSTFYQSDITSMFKITDVCVMCCINKTYSKSTLNCICLALIMGTVRKVPYKSVHSLMVTMCVTWYNIKSACILQSHMHISLILTIKSNISLNSID